MMLRSNKENVSCTENVQLTTFWQFTNNLGFKSQHNPFILGAFLVENACREPPASSEDIGFNITTSVENGSLRVLHHKLSTKDCLFGYLTKMSDNPILTFLSDLIEKGMIWTKDSSHVNTRHAFPFPAD